MRIQRTEETGGVLVRPRRSSLILCCAFLLAIMGDSSPDPRDVEIQQLKNRIAQLEFDLKSKPVRNTVEKMDELVVDSNPYRCVFIRSVPAHGQVLINLYPAA